MERSGGALDPSRHAVAQPGTVSGCVEPPAGQAVIEICCSAGVDCWPWRGLGVGRHVIGRSTAVPLHVDDPDLELFHAMIEVAVIEVAVIEVAAGAVVRDAEARRSGAKVVVRVTQLAGRVPMMAKQEPIESDVALDLPASVTFGAVEIRLRSAVGLVGAVGRSWMRAPDDGVAGESAGLDCGQNRLVRRCPGSSAGPAGGIVAPEVGAVRRLPPSTGLVAALVGLALACVTVLTSADVLATVVLLSGAAISGVNWAAQAVMVGRSNRVQRCVDASARRRFVSELRAMQATVRSAYCADHPDLVDRLAVERPSRFCASLPAEPPVHDSAGDGVTALEVTVGRGSVGWAHWRDGSVGWAHWRDGSVGWADWREGSVGWADWRDGPVGSGSSGDGVRFADVDNEVVRLAVIDDVPISVLVRPGDTWAIVGDLVRRDALARSMMCQLGLLDRSACWKLVVLSSELGRWAWAAELPSCWNDAGAPMMVDPTDRAGVAAIFANLFDGEGSSLNAEMDAEMESAGAAGGSNRVVVAVDGASRAVFDEVRRELSASAVERLVSLVLLDAGVADAGATPSSGCQQSVVIGSGGRIELIVSGDPEAATDLGAEIGRRGEIRDVRMCGISPRGAAELAGRLRRP